MQIIVYGKEGCGKCESAKKNIEKMGLKYTYQGLEKIITAKDLPDNWRVLGYVDILAAYVHRENLPLIKIDDEIMEYADAMKALKAYKKKLQAA
jgi:glutaredoxin